MRFLTQAHTIAEHKHRQMPVYETLGLTATQAMAIGAVGAGVGGLGSLGLGIYNSSKKPASYNPQQALAFQKQQYKQMAPQALGFAANLFNQAANQGIDFAQRGTAANIANQEAVTPGSQAQRQLALNQINSYIQGQIPQDVQQNINRQVAQNLGGGFNLFSGGGQAPNAFARNIGQTSVGLSQYGLSAAPTWQQLANSMVVRPEVGLQAGIQAGGIGSQLTSSAAGIGMQNAENQYTSAMNQYGAQQAGIQGIQQGLGALGSAGSSIMNSAITANYLNSLSPSMQGRLATVGGLPATQGLDALASSYGTPFGGVVGRPGTASFNAAMSAGGWD